MITTIYYFNHGNLINPINPGSNLFCNFFKFVKNPGKEILPNGFHSPDLNRSDVNCASLWKQIQTTAVTTFGEFSNSVAFTVIYVNFDNRLIQTHGISMKKRTQSFTFRLLFDFLNFLQYNMNNNCRTVFLRNYGL